MLTVLHRLDQQEQLRLRELTNLFMRDKSINGGGLLVDASTRVTITAQACLLIPNLDLEYCMTGR
ncbi:MAG: zinc-dependent peptidase [Gammaproteobacteria bacterium]|nr:zinc-dependent peptidase [Gammaproteobacteria bacterium]